VRCERRRVSGGRHRNGTPRQEAALSATVERPPGLAVYPGSPVVVADTSFMLARGEGGRVLVVDGDEHGFVGVGRGPGETLLCPLTRVNAQVLRQRLPWLRPVRLGLTTSFGFGDRLGLATPGHVRAVRRFADRGRRIAAVFAQQSVRENARTGRAPQGVLDDAMWGIFQEGWCGAWGADADHLKTLEDIDDFAAAGYTLFTIDPGDYVDDEIHPAVLEAKVRALPWGALEDTQGDFERRYLASPIDLGGSTCAFERERLWRAAVKYGRAVAHTTAMYRRLASRLGDREFELEVSVDETSSATTLAEHVYVAGELRRLGVRWVSLAPRFVGRFEKGVDYIGDPETFARELAEHAAVAGGALGPYKLSLHSGSDKFSIYPAMARLTGGTGGRLVHVKTAGTSYLEALRAVAHADPELFAEVVSLARDRYRSDRVTYHVSADVDNVPPPDSIAIERLPSLLDQFDARQVLHVTFGSVLERFGGRLHGVLEANEDRYAAHLEEHLARHLGPLMG
jgi:hypothetical protein